MEDSVSGVDEKVVVDQLQICGEGDMRDQILGDCQLSSAGEAIDVDEGMGGCSGHVDKE